MCQGRVIACVADPLNHCTDRLYTNGLESVLAGGNTGYRVTAPKSCILFTSLF